MSIHPTAIIDRSAELGADVEIGPYAVIGAGVRVGARTRIGPHACLEGPLLLGEENSVGFAVALGHAPQVKGKSGPFGSARIGSRNTFREFAQVHRAISPEAVTVLGDDNYMMTNSHVAHDCLVGSHVILCTGVGVGGHVLVEDRVNVGGGAMIGQFRRVGELSMVGGLTSINRDVPPFAIVVGERPNQIEGINAIGMRRAGVSTEARLAVKAAFRRIFRETGPFAERYASLDSDATPEVQRLLAFLRAATRPVIGLGGSVEGANGDGE
ncbi:MAG: acyl-ACP--UDP-N-acetylglucosamine O-acyltransferase [Planctomycetes bacterium]|nr:acyl-ACP--UDP-N-acetylglucosamine O-acyltransferase [Planctomycetota bacterium]